MYTKVISQWVLECVIVALKCAGTLSVLVLHLVVPWRLQEVTPPSGIRSLAL